MADAILSVRINEEQKKRFTELAQGVGINNKELMEELITVYELNKAQDINSGMSSEIKELQRLTKRISDIYINAVEKIELMSIEKENKVMTEIAEKDKYANDLEIKLNKLQEELKKRDELEKELNKYTLKIKDLEDTCENLKSLNKMQQEKIEEYDSRKENINQFIEELKKKEDDIKRLSKLNDDILQQKEELKVENEKLKEKLHKGEEEFEDRLRDIKKDHEESVLYIKEKEEFYREKCILQLKQEQYEKNVALEEKYKIEINKLSEEKEEYIKRIEALVKELSLFNEIKNDN